MTARPAQGGGRALVLAAHGSRRDLEANAVVRRLAEAVRQRRLFDEVAVAFHQGEPGFDRVLDELASDQVTVVPIMTSEGHYSETVLPEALARNARYSTVRLRQTPPLGTHPSVASLVARRVTELLAAHAMSRPGTALLVVGHGTRRHPGSRGATELLADTLRRRRVGGAVLAAFLDDDPSVAQALAAIALSDVVVVPFLIGGSHVADDLPRLVGDAGGRRVVIDAPVGGYAGLVEVVVDLARRHPPSPPPRFPGRTSRKLGRAVPGTVHLVGAGPGDPGLITARGLDLLRRADVVVHDRLAGHELLHQVPAGTELVDVGKGPAHAPLAQEAINALLVQRARRGQLVVRLKGGDPFVFGRGSEEAAACRAAGVACEVVPGISSAIAAPAAAGIPVTARGMSRGFRVISARYADDGAEPQGDEDETLVVLMGRETLAALTARLIAGGRDPSTPAACIQSATTPEQRVTAGTLATIADLADRDGLEAPVVTVIGAVAALARVTGGFAPERPGLAAAGASA